MGSGVLEIKESESIWHELTATVLCAHRGHVVTGFNTATVLLDFYLMRDQ